MLFIPARIALIVLGLAWPFLLAAQAEADSLKKLVLTSPADSNKVKDLNRIAWLIRVNNPEEAKQYAEKGLAIAKQTGYEKGIADCYNTIGVIHYRRGELTDAIRIHLQALRIRERIGDQTGSGISYINLANIYSDQHNTLLALDYYEKAAAVFTPLHDVRRLGSLYVNISCLLMEQKKYELSISFSDKAQAFTHEAKDFSSEAFAYNNKGVALEKLNRLEEAEAAYQQAFRISEANEDKLAMTDASINIGNMRLNRGLHGEALRWHFMAEKLAIESEYPEGLRMVYDVLANDYAAMNDFSNALRYYKRFKQVSDSIYNETNSRLINDLTSRWETEKYERELKQKVEEASKRRRAENDAGSQFWLIIGGTVTILIFAGYMLYSWKQTRRSKILIAAQQDQIVQLQRELAARKQ